MECRICLEDEHPETMLVPCGCRGSSAYVHERCLRTYFSYYPDRICRVCHESMGHPWMDMERTVVCATLLLLWAAVLLALSRVPITVKILSYLAITGLIIFHTHRRRLTYETTLTLLAASLLLFITEPLYLPQTVFLACALLVLATICIFLPVETIFLVLVVLLTVTYSVLLMFAVAMQTDPAFTGLFLLLLSIFWLVFLRPHRANDVYP